MYDCVKTDYINGKWYVFEDSVDVSDIMPDDVRSNIQLVTDYKGKGKWIHKNQYWLDSVVRYFPDYSERDLFDFRGHVFENLYQAYLSHKAACRSNNYIAFWSGKYPSYCNGVWILYENDKDISNLIPDEVRRRHGGTYKCYFVEEGSYYDGLIEEDWINQNNYWLNKITTSQEDKISIFKAFNERDWQGCCGGCE